MKPWIGAGCLERGTFIVTASIFLGMSRSDPGCALPELAYFQGGTPKSTPTTFRRRIQGLREIHNTHALQIETETR